LEKAVEENEKFESLKLESFCLSWKEPSEVGNFHCSRKVLAEVGKLWLKLRCSNQLGK